MKRAVLFSLVLLGFSTLLVQCVATQQDVEYTNVKVRKMDSRVENIDKEIDELKRQTVQNVQTQQAETSDRMDYLQSEIMRLQGDIEENNFFIQQVKEENKDLKKLLLGRIENSEQGSSTEITKLSERLILSEEQLLKSQERLSLVEDELKAIKEARSQEASQRALEAAQRAREAERKARMAAEQKISSEPREIQPDAFKLDVSNQNITESSNDEKEVEKAESMPEMKTATVSPPPAPEPTISTPTPKPAVASPVSSTYEQGLNLFKQKKFREAYNSFAEYLDKNPSAAEAVNARFYAAESLYEDKDYELAILEFQKVIVEHPKHELAPKAMYKQGVAFEKIGDRETARIVYNKLIDTYPASGEVVTAKTRLESLKR